MLYHGSIPYFEHTHHATCMHMTCQQSMLIQWLTCCGCPTPWVGSTSHLVNTQHHAKSEPCDQSTCSMSLVDDGWGQVVIHSSSLAHNAGMLQFHSQIIPVVHSGGIANFKSIELMHCYRSWLHKMGLHCQLFCIISLAANHTN